MEGDMKPSPFGPGGKFTATEHNEWMPGGFFLVSHSDENTPMGKGNGLAIFGYKSDEKVYTYHGLNSIGEAEAAKVTLEVNTRTCTNEDKVVGKVMRVRYTVKKLSPAYYPF